VADSVKLLTLGLLKYNTLSTLVTIQEQLLIDIRYLDAQTSFRFPWMSFRPNKQAGSYCRKCTECTDVARTTKQPTVIIFK